MVAYAEFRIPIEISKCDFPYSLIERIWNELDTPYEPDERLSQLTAGQRAIYSLQWIFSEVCNGGFDQCLHNSTGYLLPEAIEGAKLLGTQQWAQVLVEASKLLGTPFPRDRVERQERLDELNSEQEARLRQLDEQLYELDGNPSTSFQSICRSYVDANPAEFFLPNPKPEQVAQALLDKGRHYINAPLWAKNLQLAEEFLLEAQQRCREHSLAKIGGQVDSLLAQLPRLQS